jgi:hypothetical protein
MMTKLARVDVCWLVLAVGFVAGSKTLPSPSMITKNNDSRLRSSSAPSVQAANLTAPFYGGATLSATATMIAASNPGPPHSTDDAAFERRRHAARQIRSVGLVKEERSCRDGQAIDALLIAAPSVTRSNRAQRDVDAIRAMSFRDRVRIASAGDASPPGGS